MVAKVDFGDETVFADRERWLFRRCAEVGGQRAIHERQEETKDRPDSHLVFATVALKIGQTVFNLIPRERLLSFIPYNDVFFRFKSNTVNVLFRSLSRAKGKGGTVYFCAIGRQ